MPRPSDARDLAFHRLVLARPRSRWWTPVVVGLVGLVIYAGLVAALLAGTVVLSAIGGPAIAGALRPALDGAVLDVTSPASLVVGLGTIALMLPSYLLASRIVNGRRLGLVTSVQGRMRWRWLLVCTALAVAAALAATGVSLLLPADAATVAPADAQTMRAALAVVLVLVPLQAAAEEYVFRGYLIQTLGRWLRHPLVPVLLPVPLFVLGHLYDPVGQVSVGLFAIAAGWLTWRTGGLEAAIAVHVVNNLLAFGFGIAGLSDVAATAVGWPSLVTSLVLIAVFCVGVEVRLRSHPLARTHRVRRAPLPEPVPMPPPTATVPLPGEAVPPITRP